MLKDNAKQSLGEVLQAMEQLSGEFEKKLLSLRQEGVDEGDLRRLEQGVLAMKDAGRLYLTWAEHFIERLEQAEPFDEMLE